MSQTKKLTYIEARDYLISVVSQMETEQIPLSEGYGRILAEPVVAAENVPPFDRSPYDGYAFRSEDTIHATKEHPITLRVLEAIPAGGVANFEVTEGFATKVLTGAPIPPGANAVCMFEKTSFTDKEVTLFEPVTSGANIVYAGEDVLKGTVLSVPGTKIDAGLMGTMAAQNIAHPMVFKRPRVGIISTGSELVEVGEQLSPGKIYNTNKYTLISTLKEIGCEPIYIGTGYDDIRRISKLLSVAYACCDAVVTTGGVSVGDYDLTPAAMEHFGAKILFRGVKLKPGMACAYAIKEGTPIIGLSGNPASSLTNFYAIAVPALKKMCGLKDYLPSLIDMCITHGYKKSSKSTRMINGKLNLENGQVSLNVPQNQGNVVISSAIGCNAMAIIPAGSGPIAPGTILKGFLL